MSSIRNTAKDTAKGCKKPKRCDMEQKNTTTQNPETSIKQGQGAISTYARRALYAATFVAVSALTLGGMNLIKHQGGQSRYETICSQLSEQAAIYSARYSQDRHERDSISTAIENYVEAKKHGENRDSIYTITTGSQKPVYKPHTHGAFDLYQFNKETELNSKAELTAYDSTKMMYYRDALRAIEGVQR